MMGRDMTRGELGVGTLLLVGHSLMSRYLRVFGTFANIHIYLLHV
jgi:hypothetical protein